MTKEARQMKNATKQEMSDFLYSIGWYGHSAYHSCEVRSFLAKNFPGVSFDKELAQLDVIQNSPVEKGSPK